MEGEAEGISRYRFKLDKIVSVVYTINSRCYKWPLLKQGKEIMMKTVIGLVFTGLVVALCHPAYARDLAQGTIEMGGGLDLSAGSVEREYSTGASEDIDSMTMDFSVLYYLAANTGIGLSLSYEDQDSNSGDESLETTAYILGPVLSYNISLQARTSIKLQGSVGIVKIDETYSNSGYVGNLRTTLKGYAWQARANFCYFVADAVSFDLYLGYQSISTEEDTYNVDYDVNGLHAGVGLSAYF